MITDEKFVNILKFTASISINTERLIRDVTKSMNVEINVAS